MTAVQLPTEPGRKRNDFLEGVGSGQESDGTCSVGETSGPLLWAWKSGGSWELLVQSRQLGSKWSEEPRVVATVVCQLDGTKGFPHCW